MVPPAASMPSVTVLIHDWALGSSTSPSMMTINSYARSMRVEPPFGLGRPVSLPGPLGGGRANMTRGVYRRSSSHDHGREHDEGVSHHPGRRAQAHGPTS